MRYYSVKDIVFKMKSIAVAVLIAASAVAGSDVVKAETVTRKEALNVATIFFNAINGQVMAAPKQVYDGRKLTTARLFIPFYVFNHPAGGFVCVSAENKAYPILFYSKEGAFDPDGMDESQKALLTQYALDIERIRYDSNVPEDAIEAWGDINGHIAALLNAEYDATDSDMTAAEALATLNVALESGADECLSDIYTPGQWEYMADMDLEAKGSFPLGLIVGEKLFPTVVHGRKGDFFRMKFDSGVRSLYRLCSTEILMPLQVAVFGNPLKIDAPVMEDPPFIFLDRFAEEIHTSEEQAQQAIENSGLVMDDPRVDYHGGGHYSITLPHDVAIARVYDLSGALCFTNTYKSTPTAWIDISAEPHGFYFIQLIGPDGQSYGVKLAR